MTPHLVCVLFLKRVMAVQVYTVLVFISINKSSPIFSPRLQIDPNKSYGRTLGQSVDPNESNVRNKSHVTFFRHQRVFLTNLSLSTSF